MKAVSLFVSSATVLLSAALLAGGLNVSAFAQTSPALPGISVEAPKHVTSQPRQRAGVRNPAPVREARFIPATSFKSGDRPWLGCSLSAGATAWTGCRNFGPGGVPFRSFNDCMESALKRGWRDNEGSFYCSSIAYNE